MTPFWLDGLEKKNNILPEEDDARFIFTTLTVK